MGKLSRIPGFRSGSKIKATAATVGYSLAAMILLAGFAETPPPESSDPIPTQQKIIQVIEDEPTPTSRPTQKPTQRPTTRPTVIRVQPTAYVPSVIPINNEPETDSSCAYEKTCGEMSSCEEAYFYLNTCGHRKRDGDSDGVPCESICPGG